jgi:hypothetical protein
MTNPFTDLNLVGPVGVILPEGNIGALNSPNGAHPNGHIHQ